MEKLKPTSAQLKYWKSLKDRRHPEEHKKRISKIMKKMFKEGKLKITGAAKKYSENPKSHHRYIDGRSYNRSPSRYGDDWEAVRMLVYARDNFVCKDCGMNMHESSSKFGCPLHVHHKIPFLQSFDNSLTNLITLCKSCHLSAENKARHLSKSEVDAV